MIITNEGVIIRLDVNQISQMSRVTQGVRLIHLRDNQVVSSIAIIDKEKENGEESVENVNLENIGDNEPEVEIENESI